MPAWKIPTVAEVAKFNPALKRVQLEECICTKKETYEYNMGAKVTKVTVSIAIPSIRLSSKACLFHPGGDQTAVGTGSGADGAAAAAGTSMSRKAPVLLVRSNVFSQIHMVALRT